MLVQMCSYKIEEVLAQSYYRSKDMRKQMETGLGKLRLVVSWKICLRILAHSSFTSLIKLGHFYEQLDEPMYAPCYIYISTDTK